MNSPRVATAKERERRLRSIDEAQSRRVSSAGRLEILIVDDDEAARETLAACFEGEPHQVTVADNADEALELADTEIFDLAFVDLRLQHTSGLDLSARLLERCPWLKVVIVTAYGSIESAVEAMRVGAFDYVTKPISPAEIRIYAAKVAAVRSLERRVARLEGDLGRLNPEPILESRNAAMRRALEVARRVADSEATLLLTGETGTGKGVLARAIHGWSRRAENPFEIVSCPSLSSELIQSELFGHVKGAFTGAVATKAGKIAIAEGGTVFLDEIGDLPEAIQPKLLRYIQDREYERLGDPKTRTSDVRVIAATNQDLEGAVKNGTFREDLYYRVNVISIELPPLRKRPEDIPLLTDRFLAFFAARHGRESMRISDDARALLLKHKWMGNIRELQNAIERAVLMSPTDRIAASSLNLSRRDAGAAVHADGSLNTLAEMEKRYIQHVLEETDSIETAAETLGISPSTLWRRRRKYDI